MKLFLLPLLAPVSGVNAPTIPLPPGSGFDVESYSVAIYPNLSTTAVSGTETIILKSMSNGLTQLSFSPNALRVSRATVDGVDVTVRSDETAVSFLLPRTLKKGQRATVRFQFEGLPKRGVTAVKGGLYTSYFACDWMICLQDSPGDKAQLALDLSLPSGALSVGVGRAKALVPSIDGLTLHRWRSTRPTSPYLYAFAAGQFTRQNEATAQGRLAYLDMTGSDADLSAQFRQTPEIVAFFTGKAGMSLPDSRYIQLLVPGDAAQESSSFSLIGKDHIDAEPENAAGAWVIAHELAHQWWGNLVTCASWQDFWLNEGIATFMTAAWKQHKFGDQAYQNELDIARRRVARVRELGFDKPLAWPGKYPSLSARRAIQYSKGVLFLAQLRETLGETAFWNGLRRFTRQHTREAVTSKDFQIAMERESRRDLSQIFADWVYDEQPTKS